MVDVVGRLPSALFCQGAQRNSSGIRSLGQLSETQINCPCSQIAFCIRHSTSLPTNEAKMPDDSPGPQLLRNRIVQSRVYRERDRFIASIREEDVCRLASSYRNNDPCAYFEKPTCGSYNMCYLVQFGDGEKWVVRVPLAPCLAFGGRSKLESEIATTQ